MLYLVSTPIGNLKDLSLRAIEVLREVDYILCEDTRHSKPLLDHYSVDRPLRSYHKFNEAKREEGLLKDLQAGKKIALISDAGTPGISDPAQRLVQACREEGVEVTAVPGACAAIYALTISGMDTERFQFLGFVPRQQGARVALFQQACIYPGTSIFYESPKRLMSSLKDLVEIGSSGLVVLARELSKKFEEVDRGTAAELLEKWQDRTVKGEFVLMLEGHRPALTGDPVDWIEVLESQYGLSKKESIKLVAQLYGLPKGKIYKQVLSEEGRD